MAVFRVPSNYWGEVKPGSTASAAQSDVGYEANQRLKELFKEGVEYYGRVAVNNIEKKIDRLKRNREQRFGTRNDARRVAQDSSPNVSPTMGFVLIAGAVVVGYWLWKRG